MIIETQLFINLSLKLVLKTADSFKTTLLASKKSYFFKSSDNSPNKVSSKTACVFLACFQ